MLNNVYSQIIAIQKLLEIAVDQEGIFDFELEENALIEFNEFVYNMQILCPSLSSVKPSINYNENDDNVYSKIIAVLAALYFEVQNGPILIGQVSLLQGIKKCLDSIMEIDYCEITAKRIDREEMAA